jgi:hypothetical protein
MVTDTLGQAEARIGELEGEGFNATGGIRMQAVHDNNVNDLKSQIIILQNKLMEKARMDALDDPEDETTKEVILQDIIIKGYASANNRLIDENKLLKENLNTLHNNGLEDQKKHNQTLSKLTRFTPLPPDDMKETISRLQAELLRKDEFYRQKQETQYEENLQSISALKNEINGLKGDNGAQVDKLQGMLRDNGEYILRREGELLGEIEGLKGRVQGGLERETDYFEKMRVMEGRVGVGVGVGVGGGGEGEVRR